MTQIPSKFDKNWDFWDIFSKFLTFFTLLVFWYKKWYIFYYYYKKLFFKCFDPIFIKIIHYFVKTFLKSIFIVNIILFNQIFSKLIIFLIFWPDFGQILSKMLIFLLLALQHARCEPIYQSTRRAVPIFTIRNRL